MSRSLLNFQLGALLVDHDIHDDGRKQVCVACRTLPLMFSSCARNGSYRGHREELAEPQIVLHDSERTPASLELSAKFWSRNHLVQTHTLLIADELIRPRASAA